MGVLFVVRCGDGELAGDSWVYYQPADFSVLEERKRRRCCSCAQLIEIGADCLAFARVRGVRCEYEVSRFGDGGEIELAPWWMCENCGGLYYSLTDLGYCVTLGEDMRTLVGEYAAEKWVERNVGQLDARAQAVILRWPQPLHSGLVAHLIQQTVAEAMRELDPPPQVMVAQICRHVSTVKSVNHRCAFCAAFLFRDDPVTAAGGVFFHTPCLGTSGYLNG